MRLQRLILLDQCHETIHLSILDDEILYLAHLPSKITFILVLLFESSELDQETLQQKFNHS